MCLNFRWHELWVLFERSCYGRIGQIFGAFKRMSHFCQNNLKQTLTIIPTIVFHSEPQNQIQIVYSWRTKRFKIWTVEQNFFEVQPNHWRNLSTKLHPVFCNLRMRTACNLSGFIDNTCNAIQRDRVCCNQEVVQMNRSAHAQVVDCSYKLQKKFLLNRGLIIISILGQKKKK